MALRRFPTALDRFVFSSIAKPISIAIGDTVHVSGLLQKPPHARACYVMAHGAGAGMNHPFMAGVAAELARRGSGTLRYQFPYMERGAKRPDPPRLAQATVRAAVEAAPSLLPESPLIGGGKSFGGRMTSQAQAQAPLKGVCGLAFLGFPLHPADHPSQQRAAHLLNVQSRCCTYKERATLWRPSSKLNRFARNSASARR
jgi:uncharacterized protein